MEKAAETQSNPSPNETTQEVRKLNEEQELPKKGYRLTSGRRRDNGNIAEKKSIDKNAGEAGLENTNKKSNRRKRNNQRRKKNKLKIEAPKVAAEHNLKVLPSSGGSKLVTGISSDIRSSLFLEEQPDLSLPKVSQDPPLSLATDVTKDMQVSGQIKQNKRGKRPRGKRWWANIEEEDPITLQPIKEFAYPPFKLQSNTVVHYFDGQALAFYLVSRSNFENPINREKLSRKIVVDLDNYLLANKLSACNVTEAFDIYKKLGKQNQNNSGANDVDNALVQRERTRMESMRREATTLLHSMFEFSYKDDSEENKGGRRNQIRNTRNSRSSTLHQNQNVGESNRDRITSRTSAMNLGVVDDDVARFLPQGQNFPVVQPFPALPGKVSQEVQNATINTPHSKFSPWAADKTDAPKSLWDKKVSANIKQSLRSAKEPNLFKDNSISTTKKKLSSIFQKFNGAYAPYSVDFIALCEEVGFDVAISYEKKLLSLFQNNKNIEFDVKSDKKKEIAETLCKHFYCTTSQLSRKNIKLVAPTKNEFSSIPKLLLENVRYGTFYEFYRAKIRNKKYGLERSVEKNANQRYNVSCKYNVCFFDVDLSNAKDTTTNLQKADKENLEMFFKYGMRRVEYSLVVLTPSVLILQFASSLDSRMFFSKNKSHTFTIPSEELRVQGTFEHFYDKLRAKHIQWWPVSVELLVDQIKFIESKK